MELAQGYARFGVTVTLVEAADRLVPGEEPEASWRSSTSSAGPRLRPTTERRRGSPSPTPKIGSVGLKEAEARERGLRVATGTTQVPTSVRVGCTGLAAQDRQRGLVHPLVDTGTGLLVGATSVGTTGREVLAALAMAVRGRVTPEALRKMSYAYATLHRGIQDARRSGWGAILR